MPLLLPLVRPIILVLLIACARAAGAQPAQALVQVRDGVYQWQEGNETAIVFVAPDAILIADPLSVGAAQWLRGELATRFPGRPVRYVVYTAHTPDRALGSIVFPEANLLRHARFTDAASKASEALVKTKTLPGPFASLDSNRNQQLESAEWARHPLGRYLSVADVNRDGTLTLLELTRLATLVAETFREGTSVAVGGKKVQIVNPRGNFATPALYFPEERILYTGLNPATAADGFAFADTSPRDMVEWLRGAAALTFDTVLTGRGRTMTRDEFAALVRYAEDLQATAIDAYARGWSVERAAAAPALQKYAGTPADARRRANIDLIFGSLRVTRMELQGAGFARWIQPDNDYCTDHEACTTGGEIVGGGGGVRVTWSSIGMVLEAALDDQFMTSRESFFDDQAYAQRRARGSVLFRVGPTRPTSVSFDLLAGATLIFADTQGVERIKQAVAPIGGRHVINERTRAWGGTVGLNLVLPLSRSLSVFVPIRATGVPNPPDHWPGPVDVQGGIGFSIRLSQNVR